MRVSREQAAQNRERVLDAAAKLFRERGFGGVGVAELMQAAGLTHGAFYGQFGSKDDLMAEACARAFDSALERWRKAAARSPDEPLAGVVTSYLTTSHRDQPGGGCVVAALGPEAAREGPALRRVITDGTKSLLDLLSGLAPGKTQAEQRQHAIALFASMVGAIVVSRALDDDTLSKEVLRAVKASALD